MLPQSGHPSPQGPIARPLHPARQSHLALAQAPLHQQCPQNASKSATLPLPCALTLFVSLAWANTGITPHLTEKNLDFCYADPFLHHRVRTAHAEEVPAEASSPAIAFAELYKRPLGIAQTKPMGSRFSAWHKLPSMPQALQDQDTSQRASCWAWGKPGESRNNKTKTHCSPVNTDMWEVHISFSSSSSSSTVPWDWGWQPLAVQGRSCTMATCWSSPVQK